MRRGVYDLKQREGLREIRADRLAHDVLGRIVTGVDEVETVGIEEVVVAQVGDGPAFRRRGTANRCILMILPQQAGTLQEEFHRKVCRCARFFPH